MKFEDLIAFAKAGYSPADVKELMALEPPKKDVEDELKDDPEAEKIIDEDNEKDFESLLKEAENKIELLEKENEKTKQALKNAQDVNTKSKIDDEGKSDEDVITDYFRSFM